MQHKATLTKRVLSLIMVIAMMLTLAPLSVFAAETTRIVYFQNNWLWTDVRAYSFDAAGNYDVAWPGAAMTFVENDGTYDIYKFEVPATATTVIINGIKNDGSGNRDQTPDLTQFPTGVCHNMMWNGGNSVGTFAYTPPTGDDTDPSSEPIVTEPIVTQPTTPAVTYDYIIAGNNSAVFGTAWDPSNTANGMTLNAETGLYEKVYEDVGIGSLSFKVTDGTWSNCWGGGHDADGNYVLAVTAISDVTIRFNPTTKTVTAEAVPTGEEQEPVEYVTLHYRNTNVWETVNAYVWDIASNTTLNGAWPGEPITETEGHANWYTIEVTEQNAAAGIGFIFGDGTNKTADIVITKSGEYWYDNGIFKTAPASWENGTVTLVDYEVTLHFANTLGWGGVNLYTWEPFSNAGWPGEATAQDADGFYTASYTYKAPAGKGLNFIFNGGGQTKDLALKPTDFVDGKCERWVVINGSVTDDYGNVRYTADILTDPEAIAISPVVKDKTVTFEYKGATTDKVSVYGTWDNWAKGIAMTPNSHGVFSVTLDNVPTGMHLYKFVVNGAWITDPLNNWTETNADGNPDSAFLISDPSLDTNTVTVRVHFDAPSTEWNVCAWGADNLEPQYDFVNDVATITLDGRASQYIAFKVRKSIKGNSWAKQSGEIRIDLSNTTSGTIDVYVGAESAGYPVSQKLNGDVVYANKVKSIELDYDKNTVTVTTVKAVSNPETAFSFFYDGKASDIVKSVTTSGGSYVFALNETLDLVTLYKYTVRFNEQVKFTDYDYAININTVYASDKFAEEFTYTGTDLGATYTTECTDFVVWAPTAEKVEVALYATGSDEEEGAAFLGAYAMEKGEKGEWRVDMAGDLKNVYYTYRVTVNGKEIEACDPYARSTGVNGNRAMVVDLASTNPDGWDSDKNPNPVTSYTDAVIYELHVRDFSIDDSSGISEANRGKFMAFTERGTTTAGGHKTGIDYLSELGITHLHLLPIYDYGSVDETKCENFNWGYDPVNYNVPEGSYSTNPYDGALRVNEMKQMVKALHDADISVVMDVVYNHVYDAGKFGFNQIVPRYFSRVNPDGSYSNGSGCGNDTASEREMVRKYIVESVLYWAEEYHIDGFRFDLVGLLDAETINLIVEEVHKTRPDVIFYGEGWTMGTAVEGGTNNTPMATQQNSGKTPGFAYFNDRIRNLLGGNNGQSLGFASGLTGQESAVADNFMAQPDWSTNPSQIVQYASCHDNYTLMDKIILSTKKAGIDAEAIKMNNLAAAVYMTSQGIPFIHAGEEFLREKLEEDGGRSENSYNAPDSVNHIEWSNLDNATYANNSKYYQGLIAFRKAHPALRMATTAEVMSNITYKWVSNEVVMFTINAAAIEGETVEKIVVIFNANKSAKTVSLPAGTWKVCVNGTQAGTETLSVAYGSVNVAGISAMVLTQGEIEIKPEIEKFDIAFSQVDMGNALGMNFAFPAVEDIDFTGAYAVATMAGSTQTISADKWTTATIGGKTHYVFGYSNIAAKQMADEVSIVIYNAKGEAISNEYVDSIQGYVMRNVDKKDAESKALMVDMLNYGAAAQVYYGYNDEDLANAQLSEAQKAYGTATSPTITDIRVKGANYLGTRLELGSSIIMQMGFQNLTADMYATVEFTNHSGVKVSERVAPTQSYGQYVIIIDQIVVADGRMPVTVTVYNADGTVYGSATDSMASYIARMSNADSLYGSIMKFSDSAYDYLH